MSAVEFGLLAVVALALAAVYLTMRVVKPLIYNAIVGLVLIAALNFLELPLIPEVEVTLLAVATVALAGVPGVVLVLLLSALGVAFVPGVIAPFAV